MQYLDPTHAKGQGKLFVPAAGAADAILEAADSRIPLIICITEGIPTIDMMKVKRTLRGSGLTHKAGAFAPALSSQRFGSIRAKNFLALYLM